ncbi:hypothetical protein BCR35DRAFT_305969 [Leucosporidium creatinivorum]|uniref:Eisosome component PIL1-domain-containing protein n=1 Tax=Leucosporidium creatinivorum TaxID=106004 RepID=A0A1Y2EYW3_9BASI|nr:hypothetical protein BCR35DRAFT_305969 [Leucosporidium creatinivorum]
MNTLKRLNWNNSSTDPAQPNLLPPGARSPGYAHTPSPQQSPGASPSSPAYPFPSIPAAASKPQVERQTLHRSLSAVSSLLVALDALREVSQAQAKALKNVAKAEKELAICFGDKVEPGARNDVIASALQASSSMFETLAEVDLKHAKVVKKEYESLNELAGKWFTKTSKEEKAFDESLAQLDYKVQKATAAYEKTRPRAPKPTMIDAQHAAASHDRYIQSLSVLSSSISSLKLSYAESSGEKRDRVVKEVGRALCGLAEAGWRNRVEGTKKGGEKAGSVVEAGVFCESGMSLRPGQMDEGDAPRSESQNLPPSPRPQQQQQQQAYQQERSSQATLRGPRPQPGSEQDSAPEQATSPPPLDSSLFAQSPDYPSNTYTVQLAALQAPPQPQHSPVANTHRSLEAPPAQLQQRPPSDRPSSVARLGSSDSLASRRGPVQQVPYDVPAPRTHWPLDMAGGEEMAPSQSSATMYSLSSTSSDANSRNIIPPRGFVLEEEAMSPTSRTMVDHGSTGTETSSRAQEREEHELQRPMPRYGPSPAASPQKEQERQPLERTDTTASERNFVAKMREKYAEEKERKQEEEERSRGQERTVSPSLARSSSRVSNLAKRYSSPPTSAIETYNTLPTSPRPIPTHHHSNSMQPLSARSYEASSPYNEFGAPQKPRSPWSSSQPRSSWSTYGSPPATSGASRPLPVPQHRSYTLQPLPSSGTGLDDLPAEPHSSICACETCTQVKYGSARGGGLRDMSKEEEGRLQKGFRESGQGRRISLPAVFGGKK